MIFVKIGASRGVLYGLLYPYFLLSEFREICAAHMQMEVW
jgi:hypothetical protein